LAPLFSDRLSLAKASVIVDDAPAWFRAAFFDQVIRNFVDNDFHAFQSNDSMVKISWLMPRIGQLTQRDIGTAYRNRDYTIDIFRKLLLEIEWFNFFDVIEIIAERTGQQERAKREFGMAQMGAFIARTNTAFADSAIGWKLKNDGTLERAFVEEIQLAESQLALLERQEPAKVHAGKAKLMLSQRPCDAANVIKESVSAIESAGKTAFPSTSTLGDVIKALKGKGNVPPLFVSVIEKLYAFASAEPGVRHGSDQQERVTRAEAEFVYTTSLAIISYLSVQENQ
jgi:hypothetical protein